MKKTVEYEGKTVEQAIESACQELGLTEQDIEVNVIEEASKGLFGRAKEAKIEVTYDAEEEEAVEEITSSADGEEAIAATKKFLEDLFNQLDVDVTMEIVDEEKAIKVDVYGERVETIIGRRGETLDSIQYLTNIVVNKRGNYYKHIIIDVENYRKRREKTLQGLAIRTAKRVKNYQKDITLEPMNSYERMIIHSTLQDDPDVETFSEGEEPYRKVVISLK